MNFHEGKLHLIMTWVYAIVATTFLWVLGTVLGLGIFSIVPSTVTVFNIFKEVSIPRRRDRLKIWSFWKNAFPNNLKKHWKASVAITILLVVLVINYSYLSAASGLLSYLLFYITIILFFIFGLIGLWYNYLSSYYPDLSWKEVFKNSVAYSMSHLLEMIVMLVFIVAVYLIVFELTPGLLVFSGIGGTLAFIHFVFTGIQNGHNFRKYTRDIWERVF